MGNISPLARDYGPWPPRSPSRGESAETVPGVRHLATSRAEIAEHLIDLVGGERGDIEGLVQAKRHQQEGHEDRVFDGRTITDLFRESGVRLVSHGPADHLTDVAGDQPLMAGKALLASVAKSFYRLEPQTDGERNQECECAARRAIPSRTGSPGPRVPDRLCV